MSSQIELYCKNYRSDAWNYLTVILLYTLMGTVIGLIVDSMITKLQRYYQQNKSTKELSGLAINCFIVIQILVLSFCFYLFEFHLSTWFAESWQSITPGFIFVSMVFGTSFNLYGNIQKLIN